ncbi:MAG: NtaA/DmoA family FMN-dependent monooxygenase [Pseudolabrys sp.]|nr:NtaA/DmoA family FMN-dependent monooxygenase [Pseudolabrys sp.]
MKKQIHLALDLSWTNVETQWRLPGSWVDMHHPNIGMFEEVARVAERGGMDMIFFGDSSGIPNTWKDSIEDAVSYGVAWPRFEMSPWITAMSRVTSHLGFGLTYASTFMHPFYTARLLNSLDHITNGRIAFNVITSQRRADFANFGYDELVDHNERYERLEEFIDVCKRLWDSVAPDAFIWDRKTGMIADPTKVKAINHDGKFFKVKGPLSVVPSPQVHPVILQAGGSPRGTRAAAHVADHVFGLTKSLPLMAKQRSDLDEALVAEGRDPEKVGIMWSSRAIVAETDAEAQALRESMIADVPLEAVGAWLSHNTGYNMDLLPPRFSLKELQERITAANASPVGFVHLLAKQHGETAEITREEFFAHGLRASTGYNITFAGTAAKLADQMEEMHEATGSRGGFMLSVSQAAQRAVILNIVDQLVPELKRRGRYRTSYEGKNLRENLLAQ